VISWLGAAAASLLLIRAVHDRAFRFLAAMLVCFAASRVLGGLPKDPVVLQPLMNILVIASVCFEICFFRTVLHEDALAPAPRLWKEGAAATAVAVVGTAAWALAPAAIQRGELAGTAYAHEPAAFIFVISIIGYYVVSLARIVVWAAQLVTSWLGWARNAGSGQHNGAETRFDLARLGLHVGIIILGLAEVLRLSSDVVKFGNEWVALLSPENLKLTVAVSVVVERGIRAAHTMFYIAALLPIAADAAQNIPILRAHLREYTILGPLWRAVTVEFPDLTFRAGRGVYSRVYRRELEIRDALVLLGPYYDQNVADEARRAAGGGPDAGASVTAALIRGALAAHHAQVPAANRHPLPTSEAARRRDDIDWLIRIARAFAATEQPRRPLQPR